MKIKIIILIGLIFSSVMMVTNVDAPFTNTTVKDNGNVSASTEIKIDSDKILNIDAKRTFPIGIYFVCSAYWEQKGLIGPCSPSNNKEFFFSTGEDVSELTKYKTEYENNSIYYTLYAPEVVDNIPQNLINGSHFLGYYQQDEPTDSDLSTISNVYNSMKIKDPNHPVILNVWRDMTTWYPYADVLTWDDYPFTDTTIYPREDAIYAYEEISDYDFFERGNGKNGLDVNSINKPVWAVLQANGVFFPVSFISDGTGFVVPTPAEIRSNTYAAITMDVKGIVYWGYEIFSEDPTNTVGLYRNLTLHGYYRQLASEIRSFNDWLVSPTIDYSWNYHRGNNGVTFDKVLEKTFYGTQFTNFNYILKNYNGSYYLIVVNKDSRSVANVTMTIAGLTGSMTATTLGMEISGSGQAGRNVPVNNGIFTDSFDGSVVHIYQIV